MAYRTVKVQGERRLKLSWREIERTRRDWPFGKFTVHALMQSDGVMLGYAVKGRGGEYWSCYSGDAEFAYSFGTVFQELEKAKAQLVAAFADDE